MKCGMKLQELFSQSFIGPNFRKRIPFLFLHYSLVHSQECCSHISRDDIRLQLFLSHFLVHYILSNMYESTHRRKLFSKNDTEMNSSWEHPANHSNTWQMEEVLSLGAISHISATISWPGSSLKIVQHRVSGVPCWQCERIQVKCELCGGQETQSHQGSAGSGDWEEEQQRHININHVHQVSRCWNHMGKGLF